VLEEWIKLRERLTRTQFESAHANPFLVLRRGEWSERVAFDTGVVMPHQTGAPPHGLDGGQLFPIVKAPKNPFPERISVGRALNCDIVLREASVSKLHAHFQQVTPEQAMLTDVKSANGTRINGKRIGSAEAQRVISGDQLQFGGVVVVFVSPAALYDLLA
jgi:FHA domain